MRILKDFKIPDFKFPKFKMKGLSDIEEMKVGEDVTSGFGLPMMKERIFLLSGDVDIDSRPGEGTTVKITVPLRE